MAHIGERIRKRREELGMSQEELAELMGYKNRSTIAKIESGANDVVQKNIVKFADVLNTSIPYLMEWDESEISATAEAVNESLSYIVIASKNTTEITRYLNQVKPTENESKSILEYAKYIISKRKETE